MCYENVINTEKWFNIIKKIIETDDIKHYRPFKYFHCNLFNEAVMAACSFDLERTQKQKISQNNYNTILNYIKN